MHQLNMSIALTENPTIVREGKPKIREYVDLMLALDEILGKNYQVVEDNHGQIVIFTNMKNNSGKLRFMQKRDLNKFAY